MGSRMFYLIYWYHVVADVSRMFIQESPFKAAYSRNFIYDFTMYVYLLITVYLLFIYDLGYLSMQS